jgi:preprotein translocase subunit SecE
MTALWAARGSRWARGKEEMEEQKPFVERLRQWPVGVKDYVQELQAEMRRVTWPSRKQVRATTVVVIATVFAFAAYFAVVDTLIARAITKVFQVFAKQS